MAGVVPGLILSAFFMLTVYLIVRLSGAYHPSKEKVSWSMRFRYLYKVWGVMSIVTFIMVGIYVGIFTPTEAGAMGVVGMAAIAIINRRLSMQGFINSLLESVRITSMIFAIVVGATFFGYFLTLTEFPFKLAEMIVGLKLPVLGVVLAIMGVYLILGCFLDVLAMILLTLPIFVPVVDALGIDSVWFGVLVCMICEAALITPPVGMNCYVISGIAKEVPLDQVFAGIFPFLCAMVLVIGLVILFPQLALYLPNKMF